MDKATSDILKDAGINSDEILCGDDEGVAVSIDIVFDGALDESFLIKTDSDVRRIVNVIGSQLINDFPDNMVEVSSAHVYVGDDCIEGTGYPDYGYSVRSGD
jgi:hypothetical protein